MGILHIAVNISICARNWFDRQAEKNEMNDLIFSDKSWLLSEEAFSIYSHCMYWMMKMRKRS